VRKGYSLEAFFRTASQIKAGQRSGCFYVCAITEIATGTVVHVGCPASTRQACLEKAERWLDIEAETRKQIAKYHKQEEKPL